MRHGECRKFVLLDAIILIASTALGCALLRWSNFDFWSAFDPVQLNKEPFLGGYLEVLRLSYRFSSPFLAAWSLALIVARIRPPRPERRRLFRQPGLVATSTAMLAVIAESIWLIAQSISRNEPLRLSVAFMGCMHFCAFSVAGGWLTLALGGRWRAEPDWVDRGGRLVGAGWLGVLLLYWILDTVRRL